MEELHAKATSVAAKFLERRGYEVLGTEIDTDAGIVDILAIDGNEDIVLVDVMISASVGEGHHESSLSRDQRERQAAFILAGEVSEEYVDHTIRFDEISLVVVKDNRGFLRHHINAWGSCV
ncbi:YraN family protein [uncultured Senegalimassilia sp.]|uniref:YraN family protein n=1 Tax=uncultured Senegalimassilia sp. TaxID=1714350 RepID=UPI0027DB4437|nr:YraN family protein [uncultured Senegalimassilia sp.]